MGTYKFSTQVNAAPDHVFERFTDLQNAAENLSGIKELTLLTDGPIGEGTRFRETRVMFGREATEELEISDFTPGKRYAVTCESCGSHWLSTFTFTPENGGTRVDLVMRCSAQTFFAKVMSPLGLLFAGAVKKCITKDLTELKALAEGENLASAGSA